MIKYNLRPYTKDDSEFVYQAKKDAYKHYVKKFWGSWDDEKQRSFFADFIKKVQGTLLIIEHESASIGLYHGDMMDQNTYEIGNIIIIPNYQGNGIGLDILQKVIQNNPKLKMHLQVFKENPAINLYKRLGFAVIDETRTHLIMERG
jgi:ribosomal protein S18 acetylase RimI-like enzyme